MFQKIRIYCENVEREFSLIPAERKILLEKLASYIALKIQRDGNADLIFICTHNSRRSLMAEVWSNVAGAYYNVSNVHSFSGGTESTVFSRNAISALERIGFKIKTPDVHKNSVCLVTYAETERPVKCFSKVYDHPKNPASDFVAIMTCSDAEDNCPFIPGTAWRIAITYEDPKAFDNTPQQDEKYDERCRQIARELMYVFSRIQVA